MKGGVRRVGINGEERERERTVGGPTEGESDTDSGDQNDTDE